MKTPFLRFYSAGPDGSGAATAQGAEGASQGDAADQDKDKAGADGQGSDGQDKDKETQTDDRLSRENARRRLENDTLKAQLSELQEQLENLKTANMSDAEKQSEQQKKLEKRAAEAERKAKESERKYLSSRAVITNGLPEVLSEMLQGETQEEVEEHAKLVAAALEKHYRDKFKPTAPNTEGGDRHVKGNGLKPSTEQARQNEIETARIF